MFFGFSHGSYFTLQRTAETLSRKHTFLIKGRVSFLEGLEFLKFDKNVLISVICAKFVLTEYRIIERALILFAPSQSFTRFRIGLCYFIIIIQVHSKQLQFAFTMVIRCMPGKSHLLSSALSFVYLFIIHDK